MSEPTPPRAPEPFIERCEAFGTEYAEEGGQCTQEGGHVGPHTFAGATPPRAPETDIWDGSFRDEIQCPYCSAVDDEHTEYPSELQHDGDTTTVTCFQCGAPMLVTVCVSYTYATQNPFAVSKETTNG